MSEERQTRDPGARAAWREGLYRVIFGTESAAGKAFDVVLLASILLSVLAVTLESVREIRSAYGPLLYRIEWGFTILFTVEYALRLASVHRPGRYARSFFGIVDLLSILPTYLSVLIPGAQSLLVVRVLRLVRVFRVFKLVRFVDESQTLLAAMRASRAKIVVFITAVGTAVVIVGTLMYLIEGEQNGFTSIPRSMYWAVVTMTTVGYGDIAPQTVPGQMLAAVMMILGYGIIAVPTGIVSAELVGAAQTRRDRRHRACTVCLATGHDDDAQFCKHCGAMLERKS